MQVGQRHKALLALRASLLVALLFACSTPGGAQPAPPEGSELGSGLAGATGGQPGNDSPSHRAAVEPLEAGAGAPQAGCTGGGTAATRDGSGGGSCGSGSGTGTAATPAAPVLSGLPADAPAADDAMPMRSTGRGKQQQQLPSAGDAAVGEAQGADTLLPQQPPQQQQQQQQVQDQQAATAADMPAASAVETAAASEAAQQTDAAAAAAAAAAAVAAAAQAVAPAAGEVPALAVHQEEQHNFALSKEGAKVLAANKEAKKTGALLDDDSDTFLKNDCRAEGKWVMLELSQVAKVSRLELSQFELYSARVREFELLGRQSHPRTEGFGSEYGRTLNSTQWKLLGSFTAEKVKGSQTFVVEHPRWVRYLLLRFLSQHGPEPVCALNGVSVFGRSAVEELEDQLAAEAEEELGLLPSSLEPPAPAPPPQQQQQQQAEQVAAEAVPLPTAAPTEAPAAADAVQASAQRVAGAAPDAVAASAEQQNAAQGAAAAVQQQAPTQPSAGQQPAVPPAQVQQQAVAGAGSGAAEAAGEAVPAGTSAPAAQQAAPPPPQTGQQQAGAAVGSAGASTNGNGSAAAPAAGGSGSGDLAGAGGAGKQQAGVVSAPDGAAATVVPAAGSVAPLDTRLPAEPAVSAGSQAAPAPGSGSQPAAVVPTSAAAAGAVGSGAASVASTTAAQQAGQAKQQAAPSSGGTASIAGREPRGTATVPPAAATPTGASGPALAATAPPGQQQQQQQQTAQQPAQAAAQTQARQPQQQQPSEQALPLPLAPPVNVPSPPPVVSPSAPGTAGAAGTAGSPAQPPAGRRDDNLQLLLTGLTAKGKKGGSSVYEILVQEIKAAKLQHKLLAKSVAEVARNASWQYAELAGDVASLAATLAKLPAEQNVSEEALAAHVDLLVKAHLLHVTQQLAGLQAALASAAKQQHALLCFLALMAGLLALNATTFGEQWPRAKWVVLLLAAANGLVGVALQLQGSAVQPPVWLQALPSWAQAH